ncbi:MAG: LLM class flavin-dependent oxidoreductase [Candidatus Bathyarchaeota archaeon]|nr:MAG: LLM class flavin-dependent oxidoreductase [Candidatus Bathyarchaeota archaeon]
MIGDIRFGILTLQHLPWREEVKRWQMIEDLGFDSIWLADHFVNYMQPNAPWFESWTLLAALANHTNRIRIGTLVSSIPLRNPVLLARQALTVDHISNGRLELGLGAGASGTIDPVYSMIGIEDWNPAERVSRFKETVEIIDKCLRNRVTSFEGQYYRLQDATLAPPPIQQPRPPITIGAMGPRMLQIAAKYAECWNSFGDEQWGAPPGKIVENTRRRNRLLDRYCRDIDREPTSLRRSLLVFGTDAETVFRSQKDFEEVVERYTAIGISELIFYYPYREKLLPTFKKIATDVIPTLR